MRMQSTPWTRPLRAPWDEVFLSLLDGSVYRWQPLGHHPKATRLAIPADWANNKLWLWNQDFASQQYGIMYGNPWSSGNVTYQTDIGTIAKTRIVSGTSCLLWALGYTLSGQAFVGRHPSAGNFNWTHTKASDKFSFEFYLDNDLEETSATEIYDDDETFWTEQRTGSGSYDITLSEETTVKTKGTSSLKMVIGAGSYLSLGVYHNFSPTQDWSSQEFIGLYVYGANTGLTLAVRIRDSDTDADYRLWNITDNFTGWKRFVLPLKNSDAEGGSFDLDDVYQIRIYYLNINQTFTGYLDRTVVDVGQWVKIEAYVPDTLNVSDPDNILLWSWNGSIYKKFMEFDAEANAHNWGYNVDVHFLDGTTLNDVLGSPYKSGLGCYLKGERGNTKSDIFIITSDITYSNYYGCKKRIGFAIKMPPDDGQDSSTVGISQCRLKLEVYYTDSGKTTYEFENSANQYYGLQNMNEAWLAAFDATTKRVEFLVLTKRPTGVKVRADENELIDRVDLTLPAGTRVFAGELVWGDLTRDSDGDTVPDFLSGGQPTVEVAPTAIYEDDETFWSLIQVSAGSYDIAISEETTIVKSGTSSLQVVISAGAWKYIGFSHDYGAGGTQDWSAKQYLACYFYGINSGHTWTIRVSSAANWNSVPFYDYTFVDNFTGWRRLVFGLRAPSATSGTLNLAAVRFITFVITGAFTGTMYCDRVIIDDERPIGLPYLVSKLFQGGYP